MEYRADGASSADVNQFCLKVYEKRLKFFSFSNVAFEYMEDVLVSHLKISLQKRIFSACTLRALQTGGQF